MENIDILELIRNGQPITEEQLKSLSGPTPDGDLFEVVSKQPLKMGIKTETYFAWLESVFTSNMDENAAMENKSIVGTNFYEGCVEKLNAIKTARENNEPSLYPLYYAASYSQDPLRMYPMIYAENFDRLEDVLTRIVESSLQPAKVYTDGIPQFDYSDFRRLGD